MIDEVLYYVKEKSDGSLNNNLIIPQSLKIHAMQHAHELSGHLGQKKTIKKAEELYSWANLKVDVMNYVKVCVTCQRFRGNTGLQQPWKGLPPVCRPLERIGIDLIDMVAGVQGYRYSLTIVDHYSRFLRFFPLKTRHTSQNIDKLWQYVADYGTPRSLVMDNGGEPTSRDFQQFCQPHHIAIFYTTPYHPQGNGVTDMLHRSLKSVLSALCQGHPLRWPQLLQLCQIIMNQAVHTSTGQQFFFAFFSRHPPRLVGAPLPSTDGEEDDMAIVHALILEMHRKMTRRYRDVANRRRKNQKVDVGTLVWVKRRQQCLVRAEN